MINIEQLKRQAKLIKKQGIYTHMQALERLAKENGYQSWKDLLNKNKKS